MIGRAILHTSSEKTSPNGLTSAIPRWSIIDQAIRKTFLTETDFKTCLLSLPTE